MQVAQRQSLPLLNIELARSKQSGSQTLKLEGIDSPTSEAQDVANPMSPLSPSTFLSKDPTADASLSCPPTTEFCLLVDRYLLLETVEAAVVSPQTLPFRRCVDTLTGDEYLCRECSRTGSTETLMEAHHRLRRSEVVTPICRVINAAQEGENGPLKLYLLSPASYGDLHSYLRSKRRLKECEARSLFRQAAQAVYDCHRHGVVLTDLKLRRFVFADPQRTKLRLESLEEAIVLEKSDSDDGVWRKHGYPAYVTPEVLLSRGARYSGRASDLWSLGIILYTLLVGRYPFQDSGPFGLFTKIIRGHFAVPEFVSSRARCLIRNLLRRDPNQRLEAGDILLHPWFTAALRTGKSDPLKSKPAEGSATSDRRNAESSVVDQVVPLSVAPSED